METITQTLERLSLGGSSHFLNLTLFPLLGQAGYARDYLTLQAAVEAGKARVREISKGGSVPELAIQNRGKQAVLVFEGEELVGAKQNRTANVTLLAPAKSTTRIPVTCVESGRWNYQSRDLAPSQQLHYSRGRANKMASVGDSLRREGQRHGDQRGVWNDIAAKTARMHVATATSAMSDVFEAHRGRLEDFVRAFEPQPGQLGAVFAINDRIEGLELFDCSETLAEMLPKLIRSYAIDAIESLDSAGVGPSVESAQAFVERVRGASVESYPAVGEGTEVRLGAPGVIAAGLVAEQRVVHLVAFDSSARAQEPGRGSTGGSFARMRSRMRGMLH